MAAPIRSDTFKGVNVFLSRSLVPPEMFDTLHDALRLNGARLFLCSDSSRNSPNDYHVISSPDHEKFLDLKAKGCNLLGPHCILSCAKERRHFPKQGYTCCLAMDGVNVLASGFENDEKAHIALSVNAMGGVLQSKRSLEIDFVIVKNVLAAKYRWAADVLKKPIVNISWLNQCWAEHRLVPQEPYRVYPFTGLTICITRIALEERKEIERLILQNGGQYSGDLTKKCTHLVCNAPGGDKYRVAERWGHIQIVSCRWVNLSVARKVCLNEDHYRVLSPVSNGKIKNSQKEQPSQERSYLFQHISADVSEDLMACSQKISSTISDATTVISENNDPTIAADNEEENVNNHVAQDSEDEDDDLYLANCRILILGFEEKEMRRLVSLIRKGGGSRHMLLSEKLTHIILGTPTESERKEVRQLAAFGVINLVKQVWLEDCDRARKEIPVSQRHVFSDLLIDSFPIDKLPSSSFGGFNQGNNLPTGACVTSVQNLVDTNYEERIAFRSIRGKESSTFPQEQSTDSAAAQKSTISGDKTADKLNCSKSVNSDADHYETLADIFKGCSFTFSHSFPQEQKAEIVDWVKKGGGVIASDGEKARFVIERHGIVHTTVIKSTTVTSHWIRSCLEEGFLQDVSSHILYSPLRCQVPFPGFESFRFCVSQYDKKERQLLRNLCFTLGSRCTEKLTKRITHLLCKFTSGPKYEAACNWGIQSVTAEWITECIRRNMLVSLDSFRPKPVTAQDREAGVCTSSQYPTQAAGLISKDDLSQSQTPTQSQVPMINLKHPRDIGSDISSVMPKFCKSLGKRSKLSENNGLDKWLPEEARAENVTGNSTAIPDMAAAIEDLLAQSNKIQDVKLPDVNCYGKSLFQPTQPVQGQVRVSSHQNFIITDWSGREQKKPSGSGSGSDGHLRLFDSFSETQTESQVVGYEEDLSGRQQIIERVRSQSLNSTPGSLQTGP